MKVNHTLEPIYDSNSKVLILGSIPSVKSRQVGFYYGNPKNKFFKTLEKVYNEKIDDTICDKINFLKRHYIALFDVVKSCDISLSSDRTIKNVVPNDISTILKNSNIKTIFTNGKKADELYKKFIYPITNIESILLPSTSPANCPKDIDNILFNSYSKIKEFTDN